MYKKWAVASVVSFFFVLTAVGVISAADKDQTVSRLENRTLKKPPVFSWQNADGYAKEFDEYFTDTFPMRQTLMSSGMALQKAYYIPVKDSHTVIKSGFDMGTGEALEDMTGSGPGVTNAPSDITPVPSPSFEPEQDIPVQETDDIITPAPEPTPEPDVDMDEGGYLVIGNRIMHMSYTVSKQIDVYTDMLNRLQRALPDRRVISMVVPNSFPFYAPSSYIKESLDQQKMIDKVYSLLDIEITKVDAYTPISEHSGDYLFFRSDHHWTARGAYWAYTGFCSALGVEPVKLDEMETGKYEGFLGSFYRELAAYPQAQAVKDFPDTVEYFIPNTEYTATAYDDAKMVNGHAIPIVNTTLTDGTSNKYVAFTNGDQPVIHVETEVKNGKSIVVVKESYGNAVIPFLLSHYQDIYVLDYRKFNKNDLPKLKLTEFVNDNDIQEILIISYPYVPNNAGFSGWLGKMMP